MAIHRTPAGPSSFAHFEALRSRINDRLLALNAPHARRQISEFPWLYGALGEVPSNVMLVCENPSLNGVAKANVRTISGGAPTIEDQFCGGPASNCVKRLRPALCEVGLKMTPPLSPGGWRCYITNVIKQADIVKDFGGRDKMSIAMDWADILEWEIAAVRPRAIFAVGDEAYKLLTHVRRQGRLAGSPAPRKVMHYSNRGAGVTDEFVRGQMAAALRDGLEQTQNT